MANAAKLNGRGQRRSLTPRGAPRTARGRVPADLLLVAALIGLGKGLLGFKGEAVGADGSPTEAEAPSGQARFRRQDGWILLGACSTTFRTTASCSSPRA